MYVVNEEKLSFSWIHFNTCTCSQKYERLLYDPTTNSYLWLVKYHATGSIDSCALQYAVAVCSLCDSVSVKDKWQCILPGVWFSWLHLCVLYQAHSNRSSGEFCRATDCSLPSLLQLTSRSVTSVDNNEDVPTVGQESDDHVIERRSAPESSGVSSAGHNLSLHGGCKNKFKHYFYTW